MFFKIKVLDLLLMGQLLVDRFFLFFTRRGACGGLALVRLDAIGDFVLWLDSAKEYRGLYAGKRIVLIANAAWADWALRFPYWDEVWAVDSARLGRSLFYRIKTLLKVRREGFEVVIQPTYSRTFNGDSLVRASAAPQRIGFVGDESNITATVKARSNRWYTRLVPAIDASLMELERNAEFIRNLSGRPYQASIPRVPQRFIIAGPRPWPSEYIVLFPGSSWFGRRWPLKSFAELASKLYAEHRLPFVLCGSCSERSLCDHLGAELTVPFVNWAGNTTLTELVSVIYHSRMLVSNETSAAHIAAALAKPAVCVLGGGHHGRFLPYPSYLAGVKPLVADHWMPCFNCNWKCSLNYEKDGPVPCIEMVSVQSVLDLTRKLSVIES